MRAIVDRIETALPHGWRDFWLQFLVFWTFNLSYEATRGLSDGARAAAFKNGARVIDAEQRLGIYRELDLQHWVLQAPGVFEELANITYFNCQFTISFGFLLWVYFRRNHAFCSSSRSSLRRSSCSTRRPLWRPRARCFGSPS